MSNKLTCIKHDQRVIIVPGHDNVAVVVHRNGSHGRCDTEKVAIFGQEYTPDQIITSSSK